MLRLDDLVVDQGTFRLTANWTLAEGQRAAVIGPSGAGKSTLLNAIAGFVAHEGRVFIAGQDRSAARPEARDIAMLFQDGNLFPHLTLGQNVGLGLRGRLRLTGPERDRVALALSRVGLEGLEHRRPGDVSGGQQGRAALARVLVQDKKLLLLDEPFAALGPALRAEMLDLVSELVTETGATLLMVTHAPGDISRIADSIIWTDDGQANPPRDAAALMADPPAALRAYLG